MVAYLIYNEDKEVMRIVGRREEALTICSLRQGWTFKKAVQMIIKRDGYSESLLLGDALI